MRLLFIHKQSCSSLSCSILQAGTPGCTKEACKFRDEYGKFVDRDVEVFGISSDTPEKNKEFAQKERLPFPLLSDQNDFLRKSFGIKGDLFGMLKGRQVGSKHYGSLCAFKIMLFMACAKWLHECVAETQFSVCLPLLTCVCVVADLCH